MIRLFFKLKHAEAKGNRFCQCLHDGGTLDSKQKYQAFAFQAVDMLWTKNMVVCFGFTHFPEGQHDKIAKRLEEVFLDRCGYGVDEVVGSIMSDVAAASVADRFDVQKELCNMHQFDKLAQSACGDLTFSRGGQVVNPFPEGQAILKQVIDCANYFSRSNETR